MFRHTHLDGVNHVSSLPRKYLRHKFLASWRRSSSMKWLEPQRGQHAWVLMIQCFVAPEKRGVPADLKELPADFLFGRVGYGLKFTVSKGIPETRPNDSHFKLVKNIRYPAEWYSKTFHIWILWIMWMRVTQHFQGSYVIPSGYST